MNVPAWQLSALQAVHFDASVTPWPSQSELSRYCPAVHVRELAQFVHTVGSPILLPSQRLRSAHCPALHVLEHVAQALVSEMLAVVQELVSLYSPAVQVRALPQVPQV